MPDATHGRARGRERATAGRVRLFLAINFDPPLRDALYAAAAPLRAACPAIRWTAAERLQDQLDRAKKDGAKVVLNGERKDNFFSPTILADIPDNTGGGIRPVGWLQDLRKDAYRATHVGPDA